MSLTTSRKSLWQRAGDDNARSTPSAMQTRALGPPPTTTNCCVCATLVVATSIATATATNNFSRTTTVTTSTTTPASLQCNATTWCMRDNNCKACLTALWPSLFEAVSVAEQIVFEVDFLRTLRDTASCSRERLAPALFVSTLDETHANPTCLLIIGVNVTAHTEGVAAAGFCPLFEYTCFVDPSCNECLSKLHSASSSKGHRSVAKTLESAECKATNQSLIGDLSINCVSFPTCTLSKQTCRQSPNCSKCWASLVNDTDGAAAARGCQLGETSRTMDFLAGRCMTRTQASCAFFLERCASSQYCSQCLDELGDVTALSGTNSIIQGLSTLSCIYAFESGSSTALYNVFRNCPQYTPCQRATAFCAFTNDECNECLVGKLPMHSDVCEAALGKNE
jgi:hypothetical protein